jgi:hypothetical protein
VYPVETTIVTVSVDKSFVPVCLLRDGLEQQGVKALLLTEDSIRFVMHRHITNEDVDRRPRSLCHERCREDVRENVIHMLDQTC